MNPKNVAMKQIFDIKRFGKYFMYDLRQMWTNNGKAAVVIGLSGVAFYSVAILWYLLFKGEWNAPGITARAAVFSLSLVALVFWQSRTYGYVTDKKAGSDWLMIPASVAEKFISMMVITLIVIPLIFFTVYMAADWVLSVADPTFGTALFSLLSSKVPAVFESIPVHIPGVAVVLSFWSNMLYFLLFGLLLKRCKLIGALAVLLGIDVLFTSILSNIVSSIDTEKVYSFVEKILGADFNAVWWCLTAVSFLIVAALAVCSYFRIKTIKH